MKFLTFFVENCYSTRACCCAGGRRVEIYPNAGHEAACLGHQKKSEPRARLHTAATILQLQLCHVSAYVFRMLLRVRPKYSRHARSKHTRTYTQCDYATRNARLLSISHQLQPHLTYCKCKQQKLDKTLSPIYDNKMKTEVLFKLFEKLVKIH